MCMYVYMFVSVRMHMCTGTVSAYVCIHACLHEYVCMCAGLWLISNLFHPSSTLFSGGSVSQSRPEPTDTASLTSKIVLGILYPFFLRLEFQVDLYAHLVFTQVPRI